MSLLSFNHLLNLSFNFHTHRKTGEVLRILDRGAAINHTFEIILFNIVPTFVDIFVALIFFTIYFEWTLSLLIFFVFVAYGKYSSRFTQAIRLIPLLCSHCKRCSDPLSHEAAQTDERARCSEYHSLTRCGCVHISHSTQVTRGIHTDCLLNYETVKYFNGEQHESNRYSDAIRQYQTLEYKVIGTQCIISMVL